MEGFVLLAAKLLGEGNDLVEQDQAGRGILENLDQLLRAGVRPVGFRVRDQVDGFPAAQPIGDIAPGRADLPAVACMHHFARAFMGADEDGALDFRQRVAARRLKDGLHAVKGFGRVACLARARRDDRAPAWCAFCRRRNSFADR